MLFSLSEHITAAIPAAPFAVFGAGLVATTVYLRRRRESRMEKALRTSKKYTVVTLALYLFLLAVCVVVAWVAARWANYSVPLFVLLSGALFTFIVLVAAHLIQLIGLYSIATFFGLGTLSVIYALVFGMVVASQFVGSSETPYEVLVNDTSYKGTLLYAGEKGILFFVPSLKRTHYFRADALKSLSRNLPHL